MDKVRKTKEGFFKDQVPDTARNMLDTDKVDSTRDAFQLDDGTQDAINMDNVDDQSAKDIQQYTTDSNESKSIRSTNEIKKMKSEIVFEDQANKL